MEVREKHIFREAKTKNVAFQHLLKELLNVVLRHEGKWTQREEGWYETKVTTNMVKIHCQT